MFPCASRSYRRILCVSPRYAWSFATFNYAFSLTSSVKAFMPPQGILLIAALVPASWEVRFVDENIRPVTDAELHWADVLFTSGMHIQRQQIHHLIERAHRAGKLAVLGGPSASGAPHWYPDADILHCGEAGDATRRLFERLDESTERPAGQIVLRTELRLPMNELPMPAYHLIDVRQYLLCSVQFSSGCPHSCEYCDIPSLYGRRPRHKTPAQVLRELDTLAAAGTPSVYFVDDNFVGEPTATRELLEELVRWQDKWDCQVRLSCEATLRLAQYPDLLARMRDAFFTNVFFGVETPEPEGLERINKTMNLRRPILDALDTFQRYGLEPALGLIMGLDSDTAKTPQVLLDFIRAAQAPICALNILYALPGTPLYQRLEKQGRLVELPGRDSNIEFLQPYEQVVESWRWVIERAYEPAALYERYATQAVKTYPHRRQPRQPWRQLTPGNVRRAAGILGRLLWREGVGADYRLQFWSMAWTELRRGCFENIFQIAMVACHLIRYGRDCVAGRTHASNYTFRRIEPDPALQPEERQAM